MTFTNNYNGWIKIAYTIDANGTLAAGSNCEIADGVITVQSGGTFTIAVTSSGAGSPNSTTTEFKPTAIEYEPLTPDITFATPIANGTYSVKDVDGNAVTLDSVAKSSAYTLTAAPASGYEVFRWVFTDANSEVSYFGEKTKTLEYTASVQGTITCEFMKSGSAIYAVDSVKYSYFDQALTAAGSSKKIVLVSSGSVYGSTGQTEFTIPYGAQLVLPYADGQTTVQSSGADFPYANFQSGTSYSAQPGGRDSSRTYYLTIPSGTTVKNNGVIAVGGTIQGNGTMSGAHSNLQVNGVLELNSNTSVLSAVGYVYGSGSVVANGSGAKIYQPLALHRQSGWGWSNAYAGSSMGGGMITNPADGYDGLNASPRYSTQAIQCRLEMKSGDTMYGYADQHENGTHYCCSVILIGDNKDSSLIALKYGATLVSTYDSSKTSSLYTNIGKLTLEITGGATQGTIKLEMSGYTLALNSWDFPVPYNYDIILKDGEYALQFDLSLLPGAGLKVDSGATLTIPGGVKLAVFTGANDHSTSPKGKEGNILDQPSYSEVDYTKSYNNGTTSSPYYPVNGTLAKVSTLNGVASGSMMANFVVDGILNVESGAYFGGVAQTGGTGEIAMDASANVGRFTRQLGLTGHAKEVSALDKTVWASAGATIYEFYPQYFDENGELKTMEAGVTYSGANATANDIESFSFDLYTSSADVSVKETYTETINATAVGQWHVHSYEDAVTAPTCSTKGYTTHTCACGYSYKDTEVPATGHSYTGNVTYAWEGFTACAATGTCSGCGSAETVTATSITNAVTTKATCSATGLKTYTATFDDVAWAAQQTTTEVIAIDANEHAWDNECDTTCDNGCGETRDPKHSYESVVTDPTCTVGGYTTHTCSVCGDTYNDSETEAKGHDYEAKVTAPTCEAVGYTTHTCACGDSYTDSETAATGHTPGEELRENEKSATCGAEGSYDLVIRCSVPTCQKELSRTANVIPATGNHTYTEKVTTEPGCETEGVKTFTCSGCGASYTEEIAALGHTEVVDEAKAPTCTATGLTEGSHCGTCGEVLTAQETVKALGHTGGEAVTENNVAPTCTVDGSYDTVVYCTVCNAEVSRVPATVEALGHDMQKSADAVDATCGVAGKTEVKTCANGCGTTEGGEEIPAHGHTEKTVPVKDPTCTAAGLTEGVICSVCGETITAQQEIPATGHQNTTTTTVDVTCTVDGSVTVTCDDCSATVSATVIKATGHSHTSSYTDPTFEANGFWTYTCACGDSYTVEDEGTMLTAVAETNGEKYETLEEAITAADEGGTVTLLADVDLTQRLSVWKQITLDLNGQTITADFTDDFGAIYVSTAGNLTVTGNGTIVSKQDVVFANYGKITIENGAFRSEAGEDGYNAALYNMYYTGETYGTAVIKGGTFESEVWNSGVLTVEGGTLNGMDNSGKLAITGGTINGAIVAGDGRDAPELVGKGTIAISGGTFEKAVEKSWCAEGYGPTDNGDGSYGVHEHSYQAVVTAPTCTAKGYTTHTCSACDDSYVADEVAALGHKYTESVEDATCQSDGKVTYTCGNCSDTYYETIEAGGHKAGAVVIENEVAATCGTDGSYENVVYCTVCSTELSSKTVVVPATGEHVYATEADRKDATCTADGYVVMECACGATETTVLTKTGHAEETLPGTDATCTETGLTSGVKCSVCGATITAQETIPATGHTNTTTINAKDATATEDGYTGDTYCEDCKTTIAYGKTIPATGSTITTADIVIDKTKGVANINEPANGGWKLGKENTFAVSCDKACVVAYTEDGGATYKRLPATASGDAYSFTVTLTDNTQIVVAIKGDVNENGRLDALDARQVVMAVTSGTDNLKLLILDVNNNSRPDALDARQIAMAISGTQFSW